MSKLMRNRWLRWSLLIGVLAALGVGIYHFEQPEPMCVIDAGNIRPRCFAVDGHRLLTTPYSESPDVFCTGPVQVWDTRTGREIVRYFNEGNRLNYPAFSKDGRYFATQTACPDGGDNGRSIRTLHLLDVGAEKLRAVVLEGNATGSIWFSAGGNLLARFVDAKEENELQIYEWEGGRLLHRRSADGIAGGGDFTDEFMLYFVEDAQRWHLEIWSAHEGKTVATVENVSRQWLWSSDGQYFVFKRLTPDGKTIGKWAIWNVPECRIQAEFDTDMRPSAISGDNRWLALSSVGEQGPCVEVRELATGRALGPKIAEDHERLVFSPDGRWLILESWRPGLQLPGRPFVMMEIPALTIRWKHSDSPADAIFSRDSRTVFASSYQALEILGYDCETGNVRVRLAFAEVNTALPRLRMTPDQSTVVAYQAHGFKFEENWWDRVPCLGRLFQGKNDLLVILDADKCVERFRLRGWDVLSASLSNDGQTVVTVHPNGDDRRILRCWDVNAWKPLRWPIGVPAGLGTLVVLFAWWRNRRRTMAKSAATG